MLSHVLSMYLNKVFLPGGVAGFEGCGAGRAKEAPACAKTSGFNPSLFPEGTVTPLHFCATAQ